MVTLESTVAGEGKSNTGLIIFGLAIVAAAGYYLLVYMPAQEEKKQQA